MMSDAESNKPDGDWAALSSMADGEAASDAQARCLSLWAQRADARERWRDYQLIGDVLRSSELARDGAHDAAFLADLRARLAREPVVLRPPAARRRRAWAVPMAAAAGVAAVAGVTIVLRTAVPTPADQTLAAAGVMRPVVASAPAAALETVTQTANGRLIRDARLDRYFTAHRQSANGAALQMPGAGVRNVDTIVLEDR
jgi:sigma-E factor negative regulatory protein RseA